MILKNVKKHLDWEWYMGGLSRNSSFAPEFIESHPSGIPYKNTTGNWNMWYLSLNPSITLEFIERRPNWQWSKRNLCINPFITLEFIESHPDWDWNLTWIIYLEICP